MRATDGRARATGYDVYQKAALFAKYILQLYKNSKCRQFTFKVVRSSSTSNASAVNRLTQNTSMKHWWSSWINVTTISNCIGDTSKWKRNKYKLHAETNKYIHTKTNVDHEIEHNSLFYKNHNFTSNHSGRNIPCSIPDSVTAVYYREICQHSSNVTDWRRFQTW